MLGSPITYATFPWLQLLPHCLFLLGAFFLLTTPATGSQWIGKLRTYCATKGISTSGVLVFTIHRGRTADFSSLVVDFGGGGTLLDNYPNEIPPHMVREQPLKDGFYVTYATDLKPTFNSGDTAVGTPVAPGRPFDCPKLEPYKHQPTSHDHVFNSLVQGRRRGEPWNAV